MTCADFLDSLGYELDEIIDDAFWRNEDGVTERIDALASSMGVNLIDPENLDKECHNAWMCAEKGLS